MKAKNRDSRTPSSGFRVPSSTQLLVIGGGPGGYPAAFHAASLGLEVMIADSRDTLGGVCLHCGCIPSKTLLHAATLIEQARGAGDFGIHFQNPMIDIERLRSKKESVVRGLASGLDQVCRKHGVDFIQGRCRLQDEHTAVVRTPEGEERQIEFRHAIVATGSRPAELPFAPFSERIMDSTRALELKDIPDSLLIVGGGYIGLELGQVYAALGSRVSVVEMTPDLLPGVDPDLVRPLVERIEKQFDSIMVGAKMSSVKESDNGVLVNIEGNDSVSTYDRALIAVGRAPNTGDLGLEKAGVRLTDHGFIKTDMQCRTGESAIFAVGDVAGQPMLAHKATHEGRVAAEAAAGRKTAFEPRAIPAVVFTDPEIAWCGMTESEARKKELSVKTVKFPWSASGRAATIGRTDGLTKLLIDRDTGRILGAGIVGHGAGELISELVLAIEMGAVVNDLSLAIHPHPTLSETVMEAAEKAGVMGHQSLGKEPRPVTNGQ